MKNKLLTLLPIVSIVATPLALCSCWNPSNHTIKEQLNKFTKNIPNIYDFSDFDIKPSFGDPKYLENKLNSKYFGSKKNNDEKIETYLQGFKESISKLKNNQKFFLNLPYLKWNWSVYKFEKDIKTDEFLKKYFDLNNLKNQHFSMTSEFVYYTQDELKERQYVTTYLNNKSELKYDFSFIDINNLKKREAIRKEWFNGYFTWERYIIKNNLVEFKIFDIKNNHIYSCFKYMDLDSGWVEKK